MEREVLCPFCSAVMQLRTHARGFTLMHNEPLCQSWDRVCYVGGFSESEREMLAELLTRIERAFFEQKAN
jgi:hypothetical protein